MYEESKNKIIKFLAMILAVICILIGISLKDSEFIQTYKERKEQAYVCALERTIDFTIDSKTTFRELKDGYIRCTKDGVTCVGSSTWNETYTLNSPVLISDGNITAVTELKNRTAYVFNEKGKMYSVQTNGEIVHFSINKLGNLALIINEQDRYTVNLYNTKGEIILSRYENETQIFPLAVDISDDLECMAISYLDTSSTQTEGYNSKILFYSIKNEDSYTDNLIPNASVERKNEIITILKYMNENNLIAISDSSVIAINNEYEKKWEKEFGNYITAIDTSNPNIIVFGFGKPLPNKNGVEEGTALWYNLEGNKLGEFYTGSKIETVVSKSDRVAIYSNKVIYGVNTKGTLLWEYPVIQDVEKLMIFDDLSRIFAVYQNSADIINVRAKEEETTKLNLEGAEDNELG